jgi:hypothetical protein
MPQWRTYDGGGQISAKAPYRPQDIYKSYGNDQKVYGQDTESHLCSVSSFLIWGVCLEPIVIVFNREELAKNVDIWLRLQKVLQAAIPIISRRSLREVFAETAANGIHIPESSTLIVENHLSLQEDLSLIHNCLVIARNMLAMKEVAQDICSATQLDKQVTRLVGVCINVTSKGYDGENVDNLTRGKLNEITELCKLAPWFVRHTTNAPYSQKGASHQSSILSQPNDGQ